jgi:predicted transcriptional regulator YdeE
MKSKEPKLVDINPLWVTGLSVRTINSDEFNPKTAKLPSLWEQFSSSNPHIDLPIYGVYSQYDADEKDFYTVTVGNPLLKEMIVPFPNQVEIQKGKYLVFEGSGSIPEVVIATWKQVWSYFETNPKHQRSFKTDFELYKGPTEIAIHIGVR